MQLQQLQQQEQQSNSVNPKTKTALANLLSNRLQTAPVPNNAPQSQHQQTSGPQPTLNPQQQVLMQPQQPPQQPLQQQQILLQQQQQQQRRSLQNITNGSSSTLPGGHPPGVNASSLAVNQQQQPAKITGTLLYLPFLIIYFMVHKYLFL